MNNINILHVVRPAEGGIKNHVLALAEHLNKDKYKIFLACPDPEEWQEKIKNTGVTCLKLPLKGEISPISDLKCVRLLRAMIKNHRIHIVHTHGMKAGMVGRLASCLSSGTRETPRILATVHNSVYHYPLPAVEKKVIGLLQRCLARRTHRFITVSEALKTEIMFWEGINPADIHVIYNGIPVESFQKRNSPYLKIRLGLSPIRPVVGTVARLAPQKGVADFIQAAFLVAQVVDDVQFLVVGDGPLRCSLEQEAAHLGLKERLVFIGHYPDITDIYPLMDVFVVPSLSEGLSITTIEAMASGRPIVATTVGGLPELISHRETGFLVPPGDHQVLAHGVLELLKRPRWAGQLAAAAREKAKNNFTVDRMICQTEGLYGEIGRELGLEAGHRRCLHAEA